MNVNVDRIQKDLENLAEFTATKGQGTTRLSYSQEAAYARDYIKKEMANAGLNVREDALGNVIGRLSYDAIDDKPVVLIGSHFDSVPNGGMFDGPAGVFAGIEIARLFKEQNLKPQFPLEVIAMIEEEGTSFSSGVFASRALCGLIKYDDLKHLKDKDGLTAEEHIRKAGYFPEKIESIAYKEGALKAFVELHIEQGPVLETLKKKVGVVDVIVGLSQLQVTIEGKAGHAGTTPMNMRKDALLAASQMIDAINKISIEQGNAAVTTVGRLSVYPNGSNVIPEKVAFSVDIRSKYYDDLIVMRDKIKKMLEILKDKGFNVTIEAPLLIEPVKLSENILELNKKSAKSLNISTELMVSGAIHDAMIFAQKTEVGLIFVPSVDGLSHHPDEWTDYNDLAKGIEVMFKTVKQLTEA